MIPNDTWIDDTALTSFATYGDKPTYFTGNKFVISLGPKAVSDSDGDLTSTWWLFEYVDGVFKLYKYDGVEFIYDSDLLTQASVTNFGAAFDQLGKPLIFMEIGSTLSLFWYDPIAMENTTTELTTGSYPFATFDMKYAVSDENSDVLLFYIRDSGIYYRMQRDRYETEYATPVDGTTVVASKILAADMSVDYRLQLVYK